MVQLCINTLGLAQILKTNSSQVFLLGTVVFSSFEARGFRGGGGGPAAGRANAS